MVPVKLSPFPKPPPPEFRGSIDAPHLQARHALYRPGCYSSLTRLSTDERELAEPRDVGEGSGCGLSRHGAPEGSWMVSEQPLPLNPDFWRSACRLRALPS